MAKDQLEGENVSRSIASTHRPDPHASHTADLCLAEGAQTQAERGEQINHRIRGIARISAVERRVGNCSVETPASVFVAPAATREEGQSSAAAEAGRSTAAGAGGRPWKGR